MIEGIIYCYHSPSNKYYIGQTIHESKRKRQHIRLSNTGDNAYFHKAIRKHGFENFKYSVLFHFSSLNKDRVKVVLNALEIYYINKYRREGKTLYNTCQGGRGGGNMTGKHFSEESKEKMRKSHLGHKQSNETIRKRVLSLKGKRKLSKEDLMKLELGRKKNLRPVLQINQNGKVVREWNCAYNINTFNHNTIAAYLKRYGGECNYKGYTWRYKK